MLNDIILICYKINAKKKNRCRDFNVLKSSNHMIHFSQTTKRCLLVKNHVAKKCIINLIAKESGHLTETGRRNFFITL